MPKSDIPDNANRLIYESSPYLLQHAYNPVDWFPWGDEALNKAKEENKMLLISIGYAACHWCHVMEHESFEDSLVAEIMNENFICVKVDREERPDVDDVYMTACQLSSGRGCGWPLNAFALPDGRPVWAGTYFPKENWKNILLRFREMKEKDLEKLERAAESITKGISNFGTLPSRGATSEFTLSKLVQITDAYLNNIDFNYGGRLGAPKFPMPNNTAYLLKYYYHTADQRALDAALLTLNKMGEGGIYDQIGGGFARYSVDSIWKVPHFEKMLYDNGQLLGLYSHAYTLTNNQRYKEIIKETVEYIKRDHLDESGGFYSSYDADSEGEEGTFYVWSSQELKNILGDDYDVMASYWSVTEEGNWEHKNILHQAHPKPDFLEKQNLSEATFDLILERTKSKLFLVRERREKPGLDDKILTSWNGLMLNGLVEAFNSLQDETVLDLALKNARFISENLMTEDYRLYRNYKNGKVSINGFLDDYATVIEAFISLYQATFDIQWIKTAENLTKYVAEHFYNEDQKMYDYKSKLDPPLIAKTNNYSDNVIPSGNSIMARNLFKLGTLLGNSEYLDRSKQMLNQVIPLFEQSRQPSFYSNWLQLYVDFIYPPYEVAILGPKAQSLRNKMAKEFNPDVLFLGGNEENLPLLENKLVEDETYIYVCKNKTCKLPTQSVEKAFELLKE